MHGACDLLRCANRSTIYRNTVSVEGRTWRFNYQNHDGLPQRHENCLSFIHPLLLLLAYDHTNIIIQDVVCVVNVVSFRPPPRLKKWYRIPYPSLNMSTIVSKSTGWRGKTLYSRVKSVYNRGRLVGREGKTSYSGEKSFDGDFVEAVNFCQKRMEYVITVPSTNPTWRKSSKLTTSTNVVEVVRVVSSKWSTPAGWKEKS